MNYLIHVDGKMPNLALMRLSTFLKSQGEPVRLVGGLHLGPRGELRGPRKAHLRRWPLLDPPGRNFGSSLVGYRPDETMEDVLLRFNRLVELGVMPWPMVFDRTDKNLVDFQAWVINRWYQTVPWHEWDHDRHKGRIREALA